MDTYKPLISIVIPTKNRYFYLKKLLELIDGFGHKEEIEVIVQDNSTDNTEFLQYFESMKYANIKYYYTEGVVPISYNSDLSIRNSSGEYVCFLGDDDGVTKYIVECCKWMQKNKIDVVYPDGYYYYWPDGHPSECYKGSMKWPKMEFKMVIRDSQQELKKLLKEGITTDGTLPRLYHGIVKRDVLDCVWEKCGSYFPGASPDISNGVALSFVVDKFATIQFPICYSGASKSRGGGAVAMKHQGTTDFKSLPFLPENIEEIWYKRVPKVWTAPTIYCESAIESMRNMGHEDLIELIDFEKLYVYFVAHFSYFKSSAYNLTSNKALLFLRSKWIVVKKYWNGGIRVFKRKILHVNPDDGYIFIHNLDDIIAANKFVEKQCEGKNVEFYMQTN